MSSANLSASSTDWRFTIVVSALALGLIALLITSLLMGAVSVSFESLYHHLFFNNTDSTEHDVLWQLRLPRTLLAVLIGIHFALSGLILQAVIRNPLADPSVIGVSGGASLAIVVFLLAADIVSGALFVGEAAIVPLSWLPLAALIGGLLIATLVLSLSWGSDLHPARLALNGVAIGAVLNALVMWMIIFWGGNRTETIIIWLAGSLYARDFTHLWVLLPWTLASLAALLIILKPLSLLRFDETLAQSLGLHIRYWRLLAIGIAVAFAASAIAVVGPIGFIGLIIPHVSRLLVGNSQMVPQVCVSLLAGACLMLGADIVSRTIIIPLELPAGALTTLLGIPILLFLLQHQYGKSL